MSSFPLPIAAFLAGLISFLSPCVLPLVPGYVSLISGTGVEELKSQEARVLPKLMRNSVAFILGFSVVFITLGAISTEVGQLLARRAATTLRARLGMGGIALVLMLVAEFGFVLWLRGMLIREYFASRDPVAGMVYYVMLGVFAVMPLLVR